MVQESYDLLLERISKFSGLTKEEIDRKVEAKRAKLSGLISKEGAAQIISAELGINFDSIQIKISEILNGMRKVNLVGKVITIFQVREFEKAGRKGKVANLIIADDTGNIKTVLWDTNHIKLIEDSSIGKGDVIEVRNASLKNGELHLSAFSEIKKSTIILENVKTDRNVTKKKVEELKEGESILLRAVIVSIFPPRFFFVCPECGKKAIPEADGHICNEHGKILAKERFLVNLNLDDGTGVIRSVLFSETAEKIASQEDFKDMEKFQIIRDDLLGTEVNVKANVKKNTLSAELELNVFDFEKVDPEKLIEELEKA